VNEVEVANGVRWLDEKGLWPQQCLGSEDWPKSPSFDKACGTATPRVDIGEPHRGEAKEVIQEGNVVTGAKAKRAKARKAAYRVKKALKDKTTTAEPKKSTSSSSQASVDSSIEDPYARRWVNALSMNASVRVLRNPFGQAYEAAAEARKSASASSSSSSSTCSDRGDEHAHTHTQVSLASVVSSSEDPYARRWVNAYPSFDSSYPDSERSTAFSNPTPAAPRTAKAKKAKTKKERECAYCGERPIKLHRCCGCYKKGVNAVWYCDTTCSKKHWDSHHKEVCKRSQTSGGLIPTPTPAPAGAAAETEVPLPIHVQRDYVVGAVTGAGGAYSDGLKGS
jgi:hypothetical protein